MLSSLIDVHQELTVLFNLTMFQKKGPLEDFHTISQISFRPYSRQELETLADLEVTETTSFDTLGHPVPGGLYDKKLGPSNREDNCNTCGLGSFQCEGHVGVFKLPFPVYNPVLLKVLRDLMKIVCLDCERLQIDPCEALLLKTKFDLISHGLDYLINVIEERARPKLLQLRLKERHKQLGEPIIFFFETELSNIVLKETKECGLKRHETLKPPSRCERTIVELKQSLIQEFWKLPPLKKCLGCDNKRRKRAVLSGNSYFMTSKKDESSDRHNERDDDEDNRELDVSIMDEVIPSKKSVSSQTFVRPDKVQKTLRKIFERDGDFLRLVFPFLDAKTDDKSCPTDVFFWEVINIPATRFTPLRARDGKKFEHESKVALSNIMIASQHLTKAVSELKAKKSEGELPAKLSTRVTQEYMRLQNLCNRVYDCELDKTMDRKNDGVKQVIEKKEGLFRMNMMGKRVNYACRSVISPDPYITANELGIPVVFAKKLTYPQRVFNSNLKQMQEAVLNGPHVHPGAVSIEFDKKTIVEVSPDPRVRIGLAHRLESAVYRRDKDPIVHRHLITGDPLLFNRQPTLHKSSIMAHIARVLPREKTLRMHYSNCKAYNADFDGDEMNAHLPQSEEARAEALFIVGVDHQYLVPKDGTPLSGLIQDHIVAAALLTLRGTFFSRQDYHELVYGAISFLSKPIKTLAPAIMKPIPLWTGKQLISTIIQNVIPDGKPFPSVSYPCKVKGKSFVNAEKRLSLKDNEMCESQVIIRNGHHLCGLIDKSSIGNQQHGLVHVCYEVYGGKVSTYLLTAFSRLATNYLQGHIAFTLGVEDILVQSSANKKRRSLAKKSAKVGVQAVIDSLCVNETQLSEEEVKAKIQDAHVDRNALGLKQLDRGFKGQTDKVNNAISSVCLDGLVKKFPSNNLQLMIEAGAKGGTVNALQISCLLGQIELEGKRPPMMLSGKTLPSFEQYDTSPRAGGFITGRFLTGIRPQEFFFHCMAGREGLIDTAVKTSKSGYLQRCLIKHMEGLIVNYDMTVRDSDGSVVQFMYGEDGIDILKNQLLTSAGIPSLIRNQEALKPSEEERVMISQDFKSSRKTIGKYYKKIMSWTQEHGPDRLLKVRKAADSFNNFVSNELQRKLNSEDLNQSINHAYDRINNVKSWFNNLSSEEKAKLTISCQCPDPISSVYSPNTTFGVVSERIEQLIQSYVSSNPQNLLCNGSSRKSHFLLPKDVSEAMDSYNPRVSKDDFFETFCHRYMRGLCEPGEAVGLLAAQSVGEPSTQMTLNTFHFAGRGEMNVTLGIPRLREILMTASPKIATPSMDIPFRKDIEVTSEVAEEVRKQLNAVTFADVLEHIDVEESIAVNAKDQLVRVYQLTFNFLSHKLYKRKFNAKPSQIISCFERLFSVKLTEEIKRKLREVTQIHAFTMDTKKEKKAKSDESEQVDPPRKGGPKNDNDGASSDEEGEGDGDTLAAKSKKRQNQDAGYEEPEDEERIPESDNEGEPLTFSIKEDQDDDDDDDIREKEDDDETAASPESKVPSVNITDEKSERIRRLKWNFITDYDYDDVSNKWCKLTVEIRIEKARLDFESILKSIASSCFITRVGNISRAFLVKDDAAAAQGMSCTQMIKTEGVEFKQLVHFSDKLDLRRVYSNDLHAICNTFGIEAASQAIRREVKNVFAVYGIQVDPRHLSIIADFMTCSGRILGMNRMALKSHPSPLQQMSFETTASFLERSAFYGFTDHLDSPSARVVAGLPTKGGTGCFSVISKEVQPPLEPKRSFRKSMATDVTPEATPGKMIKRKSAIILPMMSAKKIRFE